LICDNIMSQKIPRIAVVGGGIAGTLCSLVLKNRGLTPILIDQAVSARRGGGDRANPTTTGGLGGRLRGVGAQFLRATDPRLQAVMGMLENAKVVREWKGRFGLLGSEGGGFLPASIVTAGMGSQSGGVAGLAPADPTAAAVADSSSSAVAAAATDTGDFCQFVNSSDTPTYVGVPTNLDLCPQIANLADISCMEGTTVLGASMAAEGGWILDLQEQTKKHSPSTTTFADDTSNAVTQHFDGLVLASHNPSLASTIVQSIVDAEIEAGGYSWVDDAIEKTSGPGDTTLPLLMKRLSSLSRHLQQVRDEGKMPLYTLQATYPPGFSKSIPFDAVSVPGSPFLQFLASEASKPGRRTVEDDDGGGGGDVWTAISTSQLALHVLESKELVLVKEQQDHVQRVMTGEMAQLVSPYFDDDPSKVPTPTSVHVKRWGAALCGKGLELQEDSITLASWRLGICGDFIRQSSAYPTPWEAAALSGLEGGERMASLFIQEQQEEN
jgi:predicted NAD/FAD-dependent oxidoreductase